MDKPYFKTLRDKIACFDFFELGPFIIIFYLLIFYFKPFLIFIDFLRGSDYFRTGYNGWTASYDISYQALFYLTLGLIFLILGYFSVLPKLFARRVPNILRKEWNFRIVPWVFGVCFVIGASVKILRIFSGAYHHIIRTPLLTKSIWYGVVGYMDWFAYFALVVAFAAYFYLKRNNDERYRLWRFAAWGAFILEMAYAFPMCGKFEVVMPIVLFLIVRFYLSDIVWWNILLVGFGISIILFPFGNLCKNPQILKTYPYPIKQPLAIEQQDKTIANITLFVFDSFIVRMDQSIIFQKILESDMPFLYGKSLLNFFIAFPPRLLWQDKPTVHSDGNSFGHSMGVLSPHDKLTSVGPTIVGDWYMNFGVAGIIFGMFLMGFLWRIFYEYLIKGTGKSLSGILIYSIVFVQVVKGVENEIAPPYAGLLKFLIIMLIIHFFLTRKSKKEPELSNIT